GIEVLNAALVVIGSDPSSPIDPAASNVVSGNEGDGINIGGTSTGVFVIANFIGTDAAGTGDFGNTGSGVAISGTAKNNSIGTLDPDTGNIIAFNDRNGVTVTGAGAVGNLISRNSIFLNDLLGIDLGDDGVTA